jgi:cell division protein FtsZ
VIDPNLEDELRITLIATGFESAVQRQQPYVAGVNRKPVREPELDSKTIAFPQQKVRETYATREPLPPREEPPRPEPAYDPDDLEVPTFLRKRIQKRRVS